MRPGKKISGLNSYNKAVTGGKDLNILFFLTPKKDIAYIFQDDSLRQAM